jgi:CDP-diacylglycerol--glycerol-3-phosphate 3-phosphatidyltransferase
MIKRMPFLIVTCFTLLRVVIALIILFFLWPNQSWIAVVILMAIGFITDLFDGMLARRWQVESGFGKIMDPLADKIICLTVLWLVASYFHVWPFWLGAIIITLYDIITMTLRFVTRRSVQPVAAASKIAKTKTSILMVSLLLLVLAISDDYGLRIFYEPLLYSGTFLLAAACVLSVWSLNLYLRQTRTPKESS